MKVNIVCVKWGDKFSPHYVNTLFNMVKRNTTISHRFVCLTENPDGLNSDMDIIPLEQGFEYCWTKLELFKRDIFTNEECCLYFDLDVVITDTIDDLITFKNHRKFIGLYDWYSTRKNPCYNSSVMRFWGNFNTDIHRTLIAKLSDNSARWGREYDAYLDTNDKVVLWEGDKRYGSDQEWISDVVYPRRVLKKNSFPRKWIRSYKKHGRKKLPKECKVMVFHGFPKPHEVDDDYVKEHWR